MSQESRKEYLEKMCDRYGRYAGKEARAKSGSANCVRSRGYERKYANKLLAGKRCPSTNVHPIPRRRKTHR